MGANTSAADAAPPAPRPSAAAESTQLVLDSVRHIVHALRESSRWAEKHVGLSGAQLFVLQKLGESSTLSVNELAARTRTHQSSVSTVVTRLADGGYVRRSRSDDDGRLVLLSLTPRGRRLVDRAPDLAQERLIRSVERLPAAKQRTLAAILNEVALGMDSADSAPAMFFEERVRRTTKGVRRAR